MFYHLAQGNKAAIVHIRKGEGGVAEGGHFKLERVAAEARDAHAAKIVKESIDGQAIVAVTIIGKQRLFMATGAFGLEHIVASQFGAGKGSFAPLHFVVFGIGRNDAAHVLRQGFEHMLTVDAAIFKSGFEHTDIRGILFQFEEHTVYRFGHFVGGGNGGQWLYFNMVDAAIPMHFLHPSQVKSAGRIAGGKSVVKAMAQVVVVSGKCGKLLVATGAGEVAVLAQAAIVKQFFAQLKTFFG